MSEPKHISPLLDEFTMGTPMSDHDGICCCPAIKENTQEKYIVKIIAIPPTQKQMDALLLSGACKDASGAMDYFKLVAGDVVREAQLLTKLSKLDGFVGYEGWQTEPITRKRLGYEVYLTSEYRRSLDKFVRRNPMTQLQAINLGLDMCAALSVCRQAGALYVDLKPTNIFVSDKKEYRIGDLGFVSMDALSYTALPDKYRSAYTPPELEDPMANVSLTTDTYALGMILYQIYNDGQLPPQQEDGGLPSPVHADYELAEIILKAISRAPEDRWQDPREMGQALVAYMQRNAVNDVPITPYIPLNEEPQPVSEEPAPPAGTPTPQKEEAEAPADEPSAITPSDGDTQAAPSEEVPGEPVDETVPGEEDAQSLLPHEMSDELSRIMAKADDLLAHETPEGVVVPEIPEAPDPFAFAREDSVEADDADVPLDPVMEDPEEDQKNKQKKAKSFASQEGAKKAKKLASRLGALMAAAAIGSALFWSYQHLYLKTIDELILTGDKTRLSVAVRTDADESLLTVRCTNQYGKSETQPLVNGQASFQDLTPNTMYTVTLEVDGLRKLVGQTSQVYTTDTTTSIVSFTSIAGPEDGSLILNFAVDGEEPDEWTVRYKADGMDERKQTFLGHSVSIEGLKLGKVYTFTLDAGKDLSLGGQTQLQVMASRLILAEDLTVSSATGNDFSVSWRTPGDIVVDSWTVRCYSSSGYDEELTVQDTEAFFSNIDPAAGYNIEVTASGMTQSARTSIAADPINITALSADETHADRLDLKWEFTGETPEGGWLVLYSIDGGEVPEVIKTNTPTASVTPRVPGARYRFTIRAADGKTVLSGNREITTADAQPYSANLLPAENVTAHLIRTPDQDGWRFEDVGEAAFAEEFTCRDKLSLVLQANSDFYLPGSEVHVLYVIRDAQGSVIPGLVSQETLIWKKIWLGGDARTGELNVPDTPSIPGDYRLTVLIDGMQIADLPFTLIP